MRRVWAGVVAAGLSVTLAACGGVAGGAADGGGPVTLRAATMLPPNGAMSDLMQWFADELEERTDGAVRTEISFGGALLSGTDTLPGLKQGRAEGGLVSPAYFPAELPLNTVIMVPMPEADQSARLRALDQLATDVEPFADELERNGLVPVGFLPNASSTVAFRSPVADLADVEGRSLRIPSQPQAKVWEELGVEPVFFASEEVYESIERNILDGVNYPLDTQVANGITEVAKHVAPDVGQSGGAVFALGKPFYDKLSDDVKETIAEIQEEWYAKADELLAKYERESCEDLLADGGKVVQWDEDDRATIARAVERVAPKVWRDEAAAAGADAEALDQVWSSYTASLEEYNGTTGYEDGLRSCS